MKDAKDIDYKELKKVVTELNATGLLEEYGGTKIRVVGKKKIDVATMFVHGVERVPEEVELPETITAFYNELIADEVEDAEAEDAETGTEEGEEEKPVTVHENALGNNLPHVKTKAKGKSKEGGKKKAEPKTKAEKRLAEAKKRADSGEKPKGAKKGGKRETKNPDCFGFPIGSMKNLFAESIMKKRLTLAEIKELPWNKNKRMYSKTFGELKRRGLADLNKNGYRAWAPTPDPDKEDE